MAVADWLQGGRCCNRRWQMSIAEKPVRRVKSGRRLDNLYCGCKQNVRKGLTQRVAHLSREFLFPDLREVVNLLFKDLRGLAEIFEQGLVLQNSSEVGFSDIEYVQKEPDNSLWASSSAFTGLARVLTLSRPLTPGRRRDTVATCPWGRRMSSSQQSCGGLFIDRATTRRT